MIEDEKNDTPVHGTCGPAIIKKLPTHCDQKEAGACH